MRAKTQYSFKDREVITKIFQQLNLLTKKINRMEKTLDEVLQVVTDTDTIEDSLVAYIGVLKQQLTDALSGAKLPPVVQAKVDAIFDKATANKDKLAAALLANTPSA